MKVYISSDIEGCAGVSHWDDCSIDGSGYALAREQMTLETDAACRGALAAGATELLVRDAHGSTRNLIQRMLPQQARLIRGSSGDLFPMITGAQLEKFDALMFVGYHSAAGEGGNPLSHTFNRLTERMLLNGEPLSEFLFYAYAAASLGLPQIFISGDEGICDFARRKVPGITAVPTKSCRGGATISLHPELALKQIAEGAEKALRGNYQSVGIAMPATFALEIRYRDHQMAYDKSFYPGAQQLDDKSLRFENGDYLEILRFIHFVL